MLLQLSKEQTEALRDKPETAMDTHVVDRNGQPALVLGRLVMLVPDLGAAEQISGLLNNQRAVLHDAAAFNAWHQQLPAAPHFTVNNNAVRASHMIVHIPPYVPPAPAAPPTVFGHLPFTAISAPNDIFYRCEYWPTSRSIDRTTGKVKAQTFAFPKSELPLVPSGFAAVGRYALPNILPACNRYELKPPAGTHAFCGASVPLYGQAGGGVEVCFRTGFTNQVSIPVPTAIPAL